MVEVFFDGILFSKNKNRFSQIKNIAAGFTSLYIGRNIIQDDIFTVIENYARTKEMPLEWIRLPIKDQELCACTFIRGGRIFVMLNSDLPISKQIFAAAHELYHIRCYLEDNDPGLERSGSILDSYTIDTGTTEEEEMEANAFAGTLLAPLDDLEQQIRIFQIDKLEIGIDDVLVLMDIFAIPYKAMILRLMEEKIISLEKAKELLGIPAEDIRKRMMITGKAKRWALIPVGNEKLGSIMENISSNSEYERLPKSRIKSDWDKLEAIKMRYGIE